MGWHRSLFFLAFVDVSYDEALKAGKGIDKAGTQKLGGTGRSFLLGGDTGAGLGPTVSGGGSAKCDSPCPCSWI